MTLHPQTNVALVTGLFTLFGFIGWGRSPEPLAALPEALLYGLLMVQTWLSLRLFFGLINPKDKRQQAVNVLFVPAYACLAWSIWNPFWFYFVWTVYFYLTVLKYVLLVGRFDYKRLLRRKLIADVLGLGMGPLMLVLFLFLSVDAWHWLGVVLFGGACVYYIHFRPLYDTREQV
jgi:hypothetical protein